MPQDRKGGVGGTVDAFNFIRRVGFPTTSRVISIFAGIALLSASISLLPRRESSPDTGVRGSDTGMAGGSRRILERNSDSSQRKDPRFQAADGTRDHFTIPNRG